MENIHERFSWKIWVIILLVVAGILLLFVLLPMLFSGKKSTAIKSASPSPTGSISERLIPDKRVSPTPLSVVENPVYEAELFKFQKPEKWNVLQNSLQPNGMVWTFTPPDQSQENPHLEVQVYNSSAVSSEKLKGVFSALGYSPQSVTIGAVPGVLYRGTIRTQTSALHEDAIVVQKNTNVFKIQFSYTSKELNSELEKLFSTIVFSFQFK